MAKSFKTPPQDPIEIVVPRDKNKSVHKLKGFGPVYCINLDGQPDRWRYMEEQFKYWDCVLYTSDAADDARCVDLGGRGLI